MSTTPLPELILYARAGCHLCAEARDLVAALLEDRAAHDLPVPVVVERDIDTDPDWQRAYFLTIPVLELGDRRLELATSLAKIRRLLADALDAEPSATAR